MNAPDRTSFWMAVSGACGFMFFLIANFTHWFQGVNLSAAVIQLNINAFVFLTWLQGYKQKTGAGKFVALIGTIFPPIMASITLFRVVLPALFHYPPWP